MKTVFVLVEGQTEETFVREVLHEPFLIRHHLLLLPQIVATSRRRRHFGGITGYGKLRRDLKRLLGQPSASAVTTMVDLYALPRDFPGLDAQETRSAGDCYARVRALERAFARDLDDPRFIPYLSLHEFEALVLAGADHFHDLIPQVDLPDLADRIARLGAPEEVDDGPETHPSARLRRLIRGYRKTADGPRVAARAGIEVLCERCPHFSSWIERLRGLGSDP